MGFDLIGFLQDEFYKLARNWDDLPYEYQVAYIKRHPGTRKRVTAMPTPVSPTSGLKIHDPNKSQAKEILSVLREATGSDINAAPVERHYVTIREGAHNKYHYFCILRNKQGNYVAANAWGRIGYPAKATIIGESPYMSLAETMLKDKLYKKLDKGYKETQMVKDDKPYDGPTIIQDRLDSPTYAEDHARTVQTVADKKKIVNTVESLKGLIEVMEKSGRLPSQEQRSVDAKEKREYLKQRLMDLANKL